MDSPLHDIVMVIKKKKNSLVNTPFVMGVQKSTSPTSSKKDQVVQELV